MSHSVPSNTDSFVKNHSQILSHWLKTLVAECFKQMAKDEVLSKFLSVKTEAAVIVDFHLQSERETLDLTEMSLLKLVDSTRMEAEVKKSAIRIQKNFQRIFGKESVEFCLPPVIEARANWIRIRIAFYRKWLSLSEAAHSPLELAELAFRSQKNFETHLDALLKVDSILYDEIVRATPSLHRFLMRKHLDYELKNLKQLWTEFKTEAFREPPALR